MTAAVTAEKRSRRPLDGAMTSGSPLGTTTVTCGVLPADAIAATKLLR